MNQREYREVYLRSWHWRQMRKMALENAEGRCAVCNSSKQLDVHHRTYERLGAERLTDLLVLCRKCHDLFHQSGRLAGSGKSQAPRQAARQRDERVEAALIELNSHGIGLARDVARTCGLTIGKTAVSLSRLQSGGLVTKRGRYWTHVDAAAGTPTRKPTATEMLADPRIKDQLRAAGFRVREDAA